MQFLRDYLANCSREKKGLEVIDDYNLLSMSYYAADS